MSPTPCIESLQLILHLMFINCWNIQQIDVKTAYLYGELSVDETVYVGQLKGFTETGKEDWVCQLQWGLYHCWQSWMFLQETCITEHVLCFLIHLSLRII